MSLRALIKGDTAGIPSPPPPSSAPTQESLPRTQSRFKRRGGHLSSPHFPFRIETHLSRKRKKVWRSRGRGGEGGEREYDKEETKGLTTPVVQARGDSLGLDRRVNVVRFPTHDGLQSCPSGRVKGVTAASSLRCHHTPGSRPKLHYLLFGSPLIRAIKTDEGDKSRPSVAVKWHQRQEPKA